LSVQNHSDTAKKVAAQFYGGVWDGLETFVDAVGGVPSQRILVPIVGGIGDDITMAEYEWQFWDGRIWFFENRRVAIYRAI
jgi:hypothetical protein